MPVIFFALISYLGWGIGDIFGTTVTRKIGGYSTTLWTLILALFIFSPYIPFTLGELRNLTPETLLLILILGLIFIAGIIAFYEGLRTGSAPLVGTIAASFAAVTVVLSITFLKETVTNLQIGAILVIFLGLLLSTIDLKEIKMGKSRFNRGILLGVVAMLSWGVYFTFIKIPVREIGWFWPNYIYFYLFPLILLFMRFKKIKLEKPSIKGSLLLLIASVVLTKLADFSYNFAISTGLTVIVAPIAGSYPTLFVVLAFLIFKDPITKQQILGIITTLIGIVLLSIFSV